MKLTSALMRAQAIRIKEDHLSLLTHFIVLFVFMSLGGATAVLFGKELTWDLANYHYYGPYALLNQRWNIDYWPPSYVQLFLNPTVDFLSYFLINQFYPFYTVFILGALHGINGWLVFYISFLFTSIYSTYRAMTIAICIAFMGMYGPVSLSELGSFMNDNLISIFVLASVLLQILCLQRYTKTQQVDGRYVFGAGFFLGIGVGLKLTAAIYVIGASIAIALLPLPFERKLKLGFIWGLSVAAGILLSSGYWMLQLWQRYHNPVFPFFNQIFHSPDFPAENWSDKRFFPKTLMQRIFYPFYFSWNGKSTDCRFVDFRFPLMYVLLVVSAIIWVWRKWRGHKSPRDIAWHWLVLFSVFSYVAWQIYFSNFRYFVAAQILAPVIIYLLIIYIFKARLIQLNVLCYSFCFIIFTMSYMEHERKYHFRNSYFNVQLPAIVQAATPATVLFAYSSFANTAIPLPHSYLIPFFPKNWRFIGIPFTAYKSTPLFYKKNVLPAKVKTLVSNTSQPIYLMAERGLLPDFYETAAELGLRKKGACATIVSDRDAYGVFLCPLQKMEI